MRVSHIPALSLLLLSLGIAAAGHAEPRELKGVINHVVIAWLKQPGDELARARFIEVTEGFASLPGVIGHRVGPVRPSERAVVDSSFDVAAVMSFKDEAALQAYLQHPEHKKAVDEVLKPLVRKVLVYDFISE